MLLVAQILNLLKIGDDENRQQNDGLTLFSSHFGEILDQLVKIWIECGKILLDSIKVAYVNVVGHYHLQILCQNHYDVVEGSTAGISSRFWVENHHVFSDLSGFQILVSNGLKLKCVALKIHEVLLRDEGVVGRVKILDAVLQW